MTKEGDVCGIQSFLNFNFRHSLFDIRYSLTGLRAQLACIVRSFAEAASAFVAAGSSWKPPLRLIHTLGAQHDQSSRSIRSKSTVSQLFGQGEVNLFVAERVMMNRRPVMLDEVVGTLLDQRFGSAGAGR